ncbi:MAG: N-acetylmuramoyl-L-alanine amidase [Firmicutes bacterium]|nr:N-acetylmuramoyl-L-alanine amidase [Bacillota bacterium]
MARSGRVLLVVVVGRAFASIATGALLLAALAALTGRALPIIALPGSAVIGKVIVVDPGHGGIDPGSHNGEGAMEKEIVLEIARDVCHLLARARAVPILTRHGDWEMSPIIEHETTRHRRDLAARIHIAHRTGADAFVSIHVNKVRSTSTRGAIVFYSRNNPESKRLATCVHSAIKDVAPHQGMSVLEGDYYVLNAARVPAVIVEVGFLSNPEEKELLLAPSYRGQLAEAIFGGLVLFFEGAGVTPERKAPSPAEKREPAPSTR